MKMFTLVSRTMYLWAGMFGAVFVARNALDWFAPPADFQTRAAMTTGLTVALLLAAGFSGAWRFGSFIAGTVAGFTTAAAGAVISVGGAGALLAIWHDPSTMALIRASGGLTEVFVLPLALVMPGLLIGTVGGVAAVAVRRCLAA